MLRSLTPAALAFTAALGFATVASAMQGPRTGNPPGPEIRIPAQDSSQRQMSSGMMAQMGQGMMGDPQMQAQMAEKMKGCACCQRMTQMNRDNDRQR